MDAELLARLQFALTIGFHFIFPSITIGLAWFNVWFMTRYHRSDDPNDRALARFWIKLFTLTFAMGVATGLVMALQFGTNWSSYARVVGDIFGAPLAAEAILAFFLESTFLAVLVAGWDRVSKRTMWFSSLMVAFGATLSGFWIIVANSWMQTPRGYEKVPAGADSANLEKVVLTDFWAAVFNPTTIPRFLHTINGALLTGSFFVMGISAFYLLRKQHREFAKKSIKAALILAFITSLAQPAFGHYQGGQVAEYQPEKWATMELIDESGKGAKMPIFAILDPSTEEPIIRIDVPIPDALGTIMLLDPDKDFVGRNDYNEDDLPPLALTFYSTHLMIALGGFFLLFSIIGLLLWWKGKLFEDKPYSKYYLIVGVLAIPLPVIAMELGWIAAEVGRQPWAVYHVLRTSDAVSASVPADQILLSIIVFTLIYAVLFVLWILLMVKEIQKGPQLGEPVKAEEV